MRTTRVVSALLGSSVDWTRIRYETVNFHKFLEFDFGGNILTFRARCFTCTGCTSEIYVRSVSERFSVRSTRSQFREFLKSCFSSILDENLGSRFSFYILLLVVGG